MTAFYMFRLVAMTFFGAYRGPAWETTEPAAAALAAGHGAPHPPIRTRMDRRIWQTTKSATARPSRTATAHDAATHGTGTATDHWHGPHESPSAMTFPLMALAVGAIVAGLVGIPAALGGGNAIEHFLEPSFTAEHVAAPAGEAAAGAEAGAAAEPEACGRGSRTGSSSA